MARISNILRNFVLFVDGFGKAGDGSECKLPELGDDGEEFLGGGMFHPINVPLKGKLLEASFKMTSYDPDVLTKVGLASGRELAYTFRGALSGHDPGQGNAATAYIARMNARIHNSSFDPAKVGDKSEPEYSLHVYRYRLTHGDRELHYIDPLNFIWRVDGVDQLDGQRQALGL